MGLLSFIKGMKIDDDGSDSVIFRTSRTGSLLGGLLVFSGLALMVQLYLGNPLFCCFHLIWFASLLGVVGLILAGLLVFSYRKTVIISQPQSKIELIESSLLCWRRATYHLDEICQIEVSRIHECFIANQCCFWTVKIYLSRMNKIETVRLFEGLEAEKAEDAAQVLARVTGKPVMQCSRDLIPHPMTDQVEF